MKNIKLGYVLVLATLSMLWLAADPLLLQGDRFFALRNLLVHYTGVIGIGVMSVGMLLALRPLWVEPLLGGIDKVYRLHKWLGVTGLTIAVAHWLWAKGPKWAVGWGWLARPPRGPRPEQTVEIFRFFQEQRGVAEAIGEWALYAFFVLAALALIKRFPYRRFFQTHRLLALVYLALVAHGVILLPFAYWSTPLGIALGVLMAGGSVAAVVSLLRRIGTNRRAVGEIAALDYHADNHVLEVVVKLQGRWSGHRAGQFAFVAFDEREGPHPFTISSAWNSDGRMTFLIKGLGDYTRTLPDKLKVGDPVQVEGPYGRFDFDDAQPRQIWVAGGIGITPFIARMQALANRAHGAQIDLFYSTSAPDEGFIGRLRRLSQQAQVRLHVRVAPREGRLEADSIRASVPDWHAASFWFCGPAAFGRALRRAFLGQGLRPAHFHQELFEMR